MGLMKYSARFSTLPLDLHLQRLKLKYLKVDASPLLVLDLDLYKYCAAVSKFSLGLKNKVRTFSDCSRSRSGVLSDSFISKMASTGIDMKKEIKLPFHCNASNIACFKSTTDAKTLDTDLQQIGGLEEALQNAIKTSSECLLNGGVMGVPTDTIYGIAGLAQNKEAVDRIYDIKQRNYEKPLAISVGTIDDIYRWSQVTVPRDLLNDLLPGPVTVVFERNSELNPTLNPKTSLVGIRIPDHIFMRDLAVKCDSPIALTSANVSGDKSCLQIEEFQHLWPLLDLVVNGGKLNDSEESRLGSTVVDLSVEGTFRIIRPGSAHSATCAVLQNKYQLKETSQAGPLR